MTKAELKIMELKDILWDLKYDIDKITEKTEDGIDESSNFSMIMDFLDSIRQASTHGCHVVDDLKKEVKKDE